MKFYEDPTIDSKKDRFLSPPDNLILDSRAKRLIDLTFHAPQPHTFKSSEHVLTILHCKSPKLLDWLALSSNIQVAKQYKLKMFSKDEVALTGRWAGCVLTVILNSIVAKSGCVGCGSSSCHARSSSDEFVAMENGREKYGIFVMHLRLEVRWGRMCPWAHTLSDCQTPCFLTKVHWRTFFQEKWHLIVL